MRSLTMFFALVLLSMAPGALAQAQDADASDAAPPTSASASKQEVNALRQEVIEQRKTIEELKAIVEKLAESKSQTEASSVQVKPVADSTLQTGSIAAAEDGSAHLVNTVLVQPEPVAEAMIDPNMKTPYVQEWQFGIQHQIKGTVIDARYVGNHGTRQIRGIDYNQVVIDQLLPDFIKAQNNGFLAQKASGSFDPRFNASIPGSQ